MLKEKIYNKKTILFIVLSIGLFFTIFLTLKNHFYYQIINYIKTYIKYYSDTYQAGNLSFLVEGNLLHLFVENDVMNLFSASLIYAVTQYTFLFQIYLFALPFIICAFICSRLYSEIHRGFAAYKIMRLGKKKYIYKTILSNSIYGGIVAVIPKIVYFLFLSCFYYNDYSHVHNILGNLPVVSFLPELFSIYHPNILALCDLILTFFYGFLIVLITIIIILYCKKSIHIILTLVFLYAAQIILCTVTSIRVSILSLYSIYLVQSSFLPGDAPVFLVLLIVAGLLLGFIFLCRFLFQRKIGDYI